MQCLFDLLCSRKIGMYILQLSLPGRKDRPESGKNIHKYHQLRSSGVQHQYTEDKGKRNHHSRRCGIAKLGHYSKLRHFQAGIVIRLADASEALCMCFLNTVSTDFLYAGKLILNFSVKIAVYFNGFFTI